MTVSVRILIKILLVVFFRRREVLQTTHFNRKRLPDLCHLRCNRRLNLRKQGFILIINSGAVLRTDIPALPVDRQRINRQEILLQNLRNRNDLLIEPDANGFRMPGILPADLLVCRIQELTVRVSDLCFHDAVELIEELLRSPEASAGEINGFHFLSPLLYPLN